MNFLFGVSLHTSPIRLYIYLYQPLVASICVLYMYDLKEHPASQRKDKCLHNFNN